MKTTIWFWSVLIVCAGCSGGDRTPPVRTVFEDHFEQELQWTGEGSYKLQSGDAFEGKGSLLLSKSPDTIRDKVEVTGPEFAVAPGLLEASFAASSDLKSMDNSYNGMLSIRFLDKEGKVRETRELGSWFRKTLWQSGEARVPVPDGAVTARLVASINKETPGSFLLDSIVVKLREDDGSDAGLRRMMFTMAQVGHLIYPGDARTAEVEVWSARELPQELRRATFVVRDYWGAEQGEALSLELAGAGKIEDRNLFKYTTTVDLSGLPLEIGRYYELHGEIRREKAGPFRNYTAFAILPEAEANSYKPQEIPFTSRTWDQRFRESPLLSRRLGLRNVNVWNREMTDLAMELDMGILKGGGGWAWDVEQRRAGWQDLLANDGAELRKRVRTYLEENKDVRPMFIVQGNEPHTKGEGVKADVDAYRIVYQEVKKVDPGIFVVGTSIGTTEEYFKYGMGQWLDAYNFHSYEDPEGVREIVEKRYPELFKKYGHPKPVWSTELGMNSQGMARHVVAGLLYRKFTNFFAGGGENASWFGLFYPDPEARIHDSFASAHNVFDARYNKYAPKMDAIAYYNAVNAITVKKFVADKVYGDRQAFLFRDKQGRALVVLWKNSRGRDDVFLPMPGVGGVRMISIDGRLNTLDAGGKGVSVTFAEDPLLLLFEGAAFKLPDGLEPSPVRVEHVPEYLMPEGGNRIDVALNGTDAGLVELSVPAFWKVSKSSGSDGTLQFTLEAPAATTAREVDLQVTVKDTEGRNSTVLSLRPKVAGLIESRLLPIPSGKAQGPGAMIRLVNNSNQSRKVEWSLGLAGEQAMKNGQYAGLAATRAGFKGKTSGSMTLKPRSSREILTSFDGLEPMSAYHVQAFVQDTEGNTTALKRPMAGFVGVPKARGVMLIDGRVNEKDWENAPVQKLDHANQFSAFRYPEKPSQDWTGPDDLSAAVRFLWDEDHLYVLVEVKDDIAGKIEYADASLWRQDGLQFLIDPSRASVQKAGKYEYAIGEGTKGIQTWCTLTADGAAPAGNVPEVRVAIQRGGRDGSGDMTYEIAIPWFRLAPFKPEAGGNLGFTLIANEDDGRGRDAFMSWFGNAHNKDIDTVGDLILLP